jgi:hypothetical protein
VQHGSRRAAEPHWQHCTCEVTLPPVAVFRARELREQQRGQEEGVEEEEEMEEDDEMPPTPPEKRLRSAGPGIISTLP